MSSEIGMRTISLVDDLKDKLGDGDYLSLMNALRDDRQEFEQELHYAFQSVAAAQHSKKCCQHALKEAVCTERVLRDTLSVMNDTIVTLTVQSRTTVARLSEEIQGLGGDPVRTIANLDEYTNPPESSSSMSSDYSVGTMVAKKYGKRHLVGKIASVDALLGKCTIEWANSKRSTHAVKFIQRYMDYYVNVFGTSGTTGNSVMTA